jgi:hypothetical protein
MSLSSAFHCVPPRVLFSPLDRHPRACRLANDAVGVLGTLGRRALAASHTPAAHDHRSGGGALCCGDIVNSSAADALPLFGTAGAWRGFCRHSDVGVVTKHSIIAPWRTAPSAARKDNIKSASIVGAHSRIIAHHQMFIVCLLRINALSRRAA